MKSLASADPGQGLAATGTIRQLDKAHVGGRHQPEWVFPVRQLGKGDRRADPAVRGNFAAIHHHLLAVFQHRQEEPGRVAALGPLRGNPVGQVGQLVLLEFQPRLFPGLADSRIARRAVVVPLRTIVGGIDPAPGEHPHATHMRQRLVAPDQQHLQALIALAHQHHGRGGVHRRQLLTQFQHGRVVLLLSAMARLRERTG